MSERGERPDDTGERGERTDDAGETGTDDTGERDEGTDGDDDGEGTDDGEDGEDEGEGTDDGDESEGDDGEDDDESGEGTGERTPGLTVRITRAAVTPPIPVRGGSRPWGVRYSASGWLCLAATLAASLVLPFVWARRPMATIGSMPGVLAGGLCVYAGARLGHLIAQGRPRFLSFMFWSFVYIWFGLAPFLQIDANRFFLAEDLPRPGLQQPHADAGDGAHLDRRGGLRGRQRRGRPRGKVRTPPAPVPGERRPLLSLRRVQILAVAALVASTVALYQVGGPGTLFTSREGPGLGPRLRPGHAPGIDGLDGAALPRVRRRLPGGDPGPPPPRPAVAGPLRRHPHPLRRD